MMLPNQIRAAREALGMTGEDLASKVGVSLRTIRRWESGDSRVTSVAHKRELAKVLKFRGKK